MAPAYRVGCPRRYCTSTAAFRSFRPELVFHLAAQIDVRVSMEEPAHDAAVNVLGSVNVFAAAYAAGVRRVVNTSTGGAIYGETKVVPTSENVPPNPISAYGLSKLTAEHYARWFRRMRGLDVVTLRYGNVYGPRQDPRGDAGVIAIFCDRVLRRAQADRLRRWAANPRLCLRRRHRGSQSGGRQCRGAGPRRVQHRNRHRGQRAWTWPRPSRRRRARPAHSSQSSLRPAPASCSAAASTSPAPATTWACRHPLPLAEGLARTLEALARS